MGEPRRRHRGRQESIRLEGGRPDAPNAGRDRQRHEDRRVDRHEQVQRVGGAQERRAQDVKRGKEERPPPPATRAPAQAGIAGHGGPDDAEHQRHVLDLPKGEPVEGDLVDGRRQVVQVGRVAEGVDPAVEGPLRLAGQRRYNPGVQLGQGVPDRKAVVECLARAHQPPAQERGGGVESDREQRRPDG